LGIAVYVDSLNIKGIKGFIVTSAFFPKIAAILLVLFGMIIIIGAILSQIKQKKRPSNTKEAIIKESNAENIEDSINWKLVLSSILMLAMYLVLMEPIGFLITTFLYLFFQITLLAPKTKRKYLLFTILSASTSILVYVVFVYGLSVILPPGILNFI